MFRRGYEERTTPEVTPRRLALVVVLMALTVVAINAAAGRFLDRYGTNLGYVTIAHKWRVLEALDEPVDWVVLGDSSLSQGFDPSILEAQTGKRAVNLGTIGRLGLTDDLWMLGEYIERFGPPERVLLIHVYDVWRRDLDRTLIGRIPRSWVLSGPLAQRYGLDAELRRTIALNRYVRLYAERKSLRKSIERTWLTFISDEEHRAERRKTDRSLPPEDPVLMDDGFIRMCGANPRTVRSDFQGHLRFIRTNEPRVTHDNARALLAIAALAERHSFEVHIINGPIYDRLRTRTRWKRYFAGLQERLRELLQDHPWVHVESTVRDFPGEQLQNIDHITCEAVDVYTRWVIDRVHATELDRAH